MSVFNPMLISTGGGEDPGWPDRPTWMIAQPEPSVGQQIIYPLQTVANVLHNYFAITLTTTAGGNFDWGDGTTGTFGSGVVTLEHDFVYANCPTVGQLPNGDRQVAPKIEIVTGNLTGINGKVAHSGFNVTSNNYVSYPVFELVVQGTLVSSLLIGGAFVNYYKRLQNLYFKGLNSITSIEDYFIDLKSLARIQEFDYSGVVNCDDAFRGSGIEELTMDFSGTANNDYNSLLEDAPAIKYTSIKIPTNMTCDLGSAFDNNPKLIEIYDIDLSTMPHDYSYTFSKDYSLKIIGNNGVIKIGNSFSNTFADCTSLEKLRLDLTDVTTNNNADALTHNYALKELTITGWVNANFKDLDIENTQLDHVQLTGVLDSAPADSSLITIRLNGSLGQNSIVQSYLDARASFIARGGTLVG